MQEDTKPKDEKILDAQPEKVPFSRSEYHGVITSYAGLVLSLIAIVLSVITMYQSHMMETREIVQILRAEDDGYYHFDGEKLFKNFQVTVANNSAIPVSVVEITIERDGEARTFEISDLSGVLPLNMEANHTEMITIPWNIDTSTEDAQKIRDDFSPETLEESDIVLSSKAPTFEDGTITVTLPEEDSTGMIPESVLHHPITIMWPQSMPQNMLDLTITLCTAKDHQYILTTQDMGAPEDTNESSWVANRVAGKELTLPLTVREFIEAMHIAQIPVNSVEGEELTLPITVREFIEAMRIAQIPKED